MAIVYCATNIISGKKYIGITKQKLSDRKKRHRYVAKKLKKHPFYDAWRKYGKENFKWEVLRECDSVEEASLLEEHYIKEINTISPNGYNLLEGKIIPPNMKGISKSEEHKKKISEANKGKSKSEETKKKISDALKGNLPWNKGKNTGQIPWNKGINHSEETKQKIGEANKRKTPWNKGVPRSEETKQKIRLTKSKSKNMV